mgnify:CR=1 FL=1
MYKKSNYYPSFVYNARRQWEEFGNVYWLFGREAELQRLAMWASNKRLPKPRQAYQNRLINTQMALSRIRRRSPQIWTFARFSFCVVDWVFPPPRYKSKGSAGVYKKNRLTIQ